MSNRAHWQRPRRHALNACVQATYELPEASSLALWQLLAQVNEMATLEDACVAAERWVTEERHAQGWRAQRRGKGRKRWAVLMLNDKEHFAVTNHGGAF